MGTGLSSCCSTTSGAKDTIVKSKCSKNGARQEETDTPCFEDADNTEPAPEGSRRESSDAALIGEFKACLKNRTKSVKDAFSRLGAADDDLVDFEEFKSFLIDEMNYTDEEQVRRIFEIMDDNKNGSVCWQEFKALKNDALGLDQPNPEENDKTKTAAKSEKRKSTTLKPCLKKGADKNAESKLDEVIFEGSKDVLKSRFKSCQEAFDGLGGRGSESIELKDFQQFHMAELDYSAEQIKQLFNELDVDNDGVLSWTEFKAHVEGVCSDSKSAAKTKDRLSAEKLTQIKDDKDDKDDKDSKKRAMKRLNSTSSSTTASSRSSRKEQKKAKDKA